MLVPTASKLRYLANARNRATIALHERHGFALQSREFTLPGVVFDGGQGALSRLVTARR